MVSIDISVTSYRNRRRIPSPNAHLAVADVQGGEGEIINRQVKPVCRRLHPDPVAFLPGVVVNYLRAWQAFKFLIDSSGAIRPHYDTTYRRFGTTMRKILARVEGK